MLTLTETLLHWIVVTVMDKNVSQLRALKIWVLEPLDSTFGGPLKTMESAAVSQCIVVKSNYLSI